MQCAGGRATGSGFTAIDTNQLNEFFTGLPATVGAAGEQLLGVGGLDLFCAGAKTVFAIARVFEQVVEYIHHVVVGESLVVHDVAPVGLLAVVGVVGAIP